MGKQAFHDSSYGMKFINLTFQVLDEQVDNYKMSWASMTLDMLYFLIIFLSLVELILIVIHSIIGYILLAGEVAETYGVFTVIFTFFLSRLLAVILICSNIINTVKITSNNLYNIIIYKSLVLNRFFSCKI